MRWLAVVVALALAGCADAARPQAPPAPCSTFAACLFTQPGPLPVVVHRSEGAAYPAAGLAALAGQLTLLAGRAVAVANGSAIGPLPAVVEDAELAALQTDSPPGELHVFVVDALRLEGDEPTAGLSFPGSPAVFLFPGTLDLRADEAGLGEPGRAQARALVEGIVLAHELGHAIGLVGCGVPMQAPPANGTSSCHSGNRTSVMHSRVARVAEWPAWNAGAPLGPFGWDADGLADLAAFRDGLA